MSGLSLPVVVFLTSAKCGHCIGMRLDGRLQSSSNNKGRPPTINSRYHFDEAFIAKLLTGGRGGPHASVRVLNIHTKTIDVEGYAEYSEFFLGEGGVGVKQVMYRPQIMTPPQLLEIETLQITETTRTNLGIEKAIATTWDDFVKESIPVHFKPFCYFYPSIMLFRSESWLKGLQGEIFNGVVFGGKTKTEPPYGMMHGKGVVDNDQPDVFPLLTNYLLGKVRIPDETPVAATPLATPAPTATPTAVAVAPAAVQVAPIATAVAPVGVGPNTKLWLPTAVCKPPTFTLVKHNLNR